MTTPCSFCYQSYNQLLRLLARVPAAAVQTGLGDVETNCLGHLRLASAVHQVLLQRLLPLLNCVRSLSLTPMKASQASCMSIGEKSIILRPALLYWYMLSTLQIPSKASNTSASPRRCLRILSASVRIARQAPQYSSYHDIDRRRYGGEAGRPLCDVLALGLLLREARRRHQQRHDRY